MINTELNCCINNKQWNNALPNWQKIATKVVSLTVNFVSDNDTIPFYQPNKLLSFNLCLSDDTEIHTLNKEFRNQDKPTNVLSFASIDDPDFEDYAQQNQILEMGDIIIALETLQKEAELKQIPLCNHFCHLLAHGTLHLLGYDHINDDDADYMENFEIQILKILNIKNPYEE